MLLPTRCPVCRRPGPVPCAACCAALQPPPPGPVPAVFAYEGVGRQLIAALKYRGARLAVGPFAAAMAALVPDASVDVVTWAPTGAARRRRRGFDQAELLARATAHRLRVPCRRLLRRQRHSAPQTGAHRAARLAGPAFAVTGRVPARVLVVDDVTTTGATLLSARAALLAAGATVVRLVAVAATPPPGWVPGDDLRACTVGPVAPGRGSRS